ncbi:MAG: hypothetical protein Q9169_002274 [Polycauliona sp. 2 TL-2023]
MTSVSQVQDLLRLLASAKIPIPLAMSKIQALKEASLTTPESLSKAPLPTLQSIFGDEKLAKQVISTAKRASRKRTSSSISGTSPSPKKAKTSPLQPGQEMSPAEIEASLALPTLDPSKFNDIEADINNTVLYTNRAPLMVAFVVQLSKHTMPNQPLSSRLSLAQAVMSMGAQAKALNLGIQSGKTAEEEGWGEGQPSVRIMGRKIAVMRRWGYDWKDHRERSRDQDTIKREEDEPELPVTSEAIPATSEPRDDTESQETIKGDPSTPPHTISPNRPQINPQLTESDTHDPPLWALNLETLSKSSTNTPSLSNNLPIYDPHSARNYMLKAFATSSSSGPSPPPSPSSKKPAKSAALAKEKEEKENNLARLLHALDLVFASWIDVIGAEELDRRAFGWYSRVRPSVQAGREGWGGKGDVKLADLLKLRR